MIQSHHIQYIYKHSQKGFIQTKQTHFYTLFQK